MSDDILDNPVLASLRGVHRSLALVDGRVARYPGDVCPFMAVPDNVRPEEWEQLAALAGDDPVVLVNPPASVPKSWTLVNGLSALQMLGPEADHAAAVATPGWAVETLRREDAGAMLELAVATQPGPFAAPGSSASTSVCGIVGS